MYSFSATCFHAGWVRFVMNAGHVTRTVAILGATLLFVGAAQAYSDEAVQDAQALLNSLTPPGVNLGGDVDVALARYYLLEMRYKAGQIAVGDFCSSAAPALKDLAEAYKASEDESGDLKHWRHEIAVMRDSRTMCEQAAKTAALLLYGDNGTTESLSVKDAEERVAQTQDRGAVGEATKADVAQAQFDLAEAKFRAGQISRDAYCQSAVPNLQTIELQVQEESLSAPVTLQDVISAKRTLYKIKALCATGGQNKVSSDKVSGPDK
jgi:hypothetical protein